MHPELVHSRRGSALMVAIALLALGAALLVGSSGAARSSARAQRSYEAATVANGEVRHALAEALAGWGGADDSLAVGSSREASVGGGPKVRETLRVTRLADRRWVIEVDCRVGPDSAPLARRRLQLVVERPTVLDTAARPAPPLPIRRWALADLY